MRRIAPMFIAAIAALSLMGCSGGANSPDASKSTESAPQVEGISIDDIAWSVDEGIIDGERYVLMEYTNNSPYTISGIEIAFTEKEGISDEDKETYYSEVQEAFKLNDEDAAEIREKPISMHAETSDVVSAGESTSEIRCYYYSGSYYLKNINHYNLVEPDIATIQYIADGQVRTVNHDFKSGKSTEENKTVEAYQWSTTDLGNHIPRPDVQIVEAGRSDDEIFMFDAYGMSLEQFNAYVEQCKNQGYTIDSSSLEDLYDADNEEGYNIHLTYWDKGYMSATVKAPENANPPEEDAA